MYENQPCLTVTGEITDIEPDIHLKDIRKSVQGELISHKKKKYQPNTVTVIDSQIHSNQNIQSSLALRVNAIVDSSLLEF